MERRAMHRVPYIKPMGKHNCLAFNEDKTIGELELLGEVTTDILLFAGVPYESRAGKIKKVEITANSDGSITYKIYGIPDKKNLDIVIKVLRGTFVWDT